MASSNQPQSKLYNRSIMQAYQDLRWKHPEEFEQLLKVRMDSNGCTMKRRYLERNQPNKEE